MRFDLLVAFVNPNNTEKMIKTAKKSGATGDVIIHGKGSGMEPDSFMGLSIQDKTDIVLFVVEEHHTKRIMDAVSEKCNIEEHGNGVMVALKLDKVTGLSRQIEKIRENLQTEQL